VVASSVEHGTEEVSQDSIACPSTSEDVVSTTSKSKNVRINLLSKDTETAVASESVTRAGLLEQSTVVPPTLVGTVHVQEVLVLGQLQLHPCTLRVALSMPFGKSCEG
jgi:hypothetical protein